MLTCLGTKVRNKSRINPKDFRFFYKNPYIFTLSPLFKQLFEVFVRQNGYYDLTIGRIVGLILLE